jgi:hypothetical protein
VKFRREFALLITAVICAIAVTFPAPKPGLGFAARGASFEIGSRASAETLASNEATMAALRQQASAALASLQAGSAARP